MYNDHVVRIRRSHQDKEASRFTRGDSDTEVRKTRGRNTTRAAQQYIDILHHHCPCRVITQGALARLQLEKEKEYQMLRIFGEQPSAVRKLVGQHCSYYSCNDN
jgi:hypothetical protein